MTRVLYTGDMGMVTMKVCSWCMSRLGGSPAVATRNTPPWRGFSSARATGAGHSPSTSTTLSTRPMTLQRSIFPSCLRPAPAPHTAPTTASCQPGWCCIWSDYCRVCAVRIVAQHHRHEERTEAVQGTGGSDCTAGTSGRRPHGSHIQTLPGSVLPSTLAVSGQAQPYRQNPWSAAGSLLSQPHVLQAPVQPVAGHGLVVADAR